MTGELIETACQAQEKFSLDELEAHAAKIRAENRHLAPPHYRMTLREGESRREVCYVTLERDGKQARCSLFVGIDNRGRAYAEISTLGKTESGDVRKTARMGWTSGLC